MYTGVPADGSAIDPVNGGDLTATHLFASDGSESDFFGYASAMNDLGVVLVGAYGDDDGGTNVGSAYLYRPNGSGGYEELKLTASDGAASDLFGFSVALNNSGVAVVSSHGNEIVGAAYVYRPDGSGGHFETKLVPSGIAVGDGFGRQLSINETGVIAITANADDAVGSVYVYEPDGFGGYDEVKLTASDGSVGDNFGISTTVGDGGQVVVGAYLDDDDGSSSGSVYVYTPDGSGGYTEAKLTASDASAGDRFGFATDVNTSGTIAVGAYGGDDGSVANSGAVYVYTPDGSGGYTETKLVALDQFANDQFGYDVVINDDGVIVVGAYGNDDAGSESGAGYVFVPDGTGGYTEIKLTAPNGAAIDRFGVSVAINSDGVVSIGGNRSDGNVADSGAVYTFVPDENGDYVGPDGTVYTASGAAEEQVTGTENGETLTGGAADDVILAAGGDDVITGGSGSDHLTGGSGDDLFHFSFGDLGHDTITDFAAGAASDDVIEFESGVFSDLASVLAAASDDGRDTTITIDAETSVLIQNVVVSSLHQDDFRFV